MRKRLFAIGFFLTITLIFTSCNSKANDKENLPNSSNQQAVSDNTSSSGNKDTDSNNSQSKQETSKPTNQKPSVKDVKCRVYFFNKAELAHYYIEKTLPVEDGAIIKALTKELQNTSYNKDFIALTNKVKIKSAKVDEKTGILKIVFSDDYVKHMTLGTATESGLLSSLLATYGYNLGVEKIAIYFNDTQYKCLGDLPEGYFKVHSLSAKKYNP